MIVIDKKCPYLGELTQQGQLIGKGAYFAIYANQIISSEICI